MAYKKGHKDIETLVKESLKYLTVMQMIRKDDHPAKPTKWKD